MTGECIHSPVLTPDTCTMCQSAPGPAPRVNRHTRGPVFPARYAGQCPTCSLPIVVGQLVQSWSDGKYRHAGGDHPCTP